MKRFSHNPKTPDSASFNSIQGTWTLLCTANIKICGEAPQIQMLFTYQQKNIFVLFQIVYFIPVVLIWCLATYNIIKVYYSCLFDGTIKLSPESIAFNISDIYFRCIFQILKRKNCAIQELDYYNQYYHWACQSKRF